MTSNIIVRLHLHYIRHCSLLCSGKFSEKWHINVDLFTSLKMFYCMVQSIFFLIAGTLATATNMHYNDDGDGKTSRYTLYRIM